MTHPEFLRNRIKYCKEVPIELIEDPIFIREEKEEDLLESVRAHGVFSVIYVRELPDGHYRVIDGKRRKNVFRQLGVKTVYVCVVDVKDELEELALIRAFSIVKPMSQKDFLRYIKAWVDLGITNYREIARRVGVKKSSIYRAFWVLKFPEKIKRAFLEERVPLSLADVVHKTLPILGEDFVAEVFDKVLKVTESRKEAGIAITRILERAYKTVKEQEKMREEEETQDLREETTDLKKEEALLESPITEHSEQEDIQEAGQRVVEQEAQQSDVITIPEKVKLEFIEPFFKSTGELKVSLEKEIESRKKELDAYSRRRLKQALRHLQKAYDILAEFI